MKTFIALLLSSIVLSGCEAAFAADNRNLPSRPRNPFVIRDGCGQNARLSITGRCVPIPVVEPFSQTLLSFAPLTDDVGLGAECACADITLEDGTPITYAHSTPSIPLGCVRGNELQVANGDLVFCTNKPRVMRGGDGTGGKGLSIWMPRVHYALHNTAMENAVWTKGGTNPPTVTGTNTIVAPDGTTTADAVAFGATSSYLYQAACSVNYEARWVWLRSEAASHTGMSLCGGVACAACTAVSTHWTRCDYAQLNDNSTALLLDNGGSAATIYVWGMDCTDNTQQHVSPRPPVVVTGASTVTTGFETAFAPVFVPMRSDLKLTAVIQPQNGTHYLNTIASLGNSTITKFSASTYQRAAYCESSTGGVHTVATAGSALSHTAESTVVCTYDGESNLETCVGSSCADAGIGAAVSSEQLLSIGGYDNGFGSPTYPLNGVAKQVTAKTSSTKTIRLIGDSIVEVTGAGIGMRPQDIIHRELGNAVAIENGGVSTYTVEQCGATWDAYVAAIVAGHQQDRSYLMVQCGINSASAPADGGTALSNVTSRLQLMLLSARDAGITHAMGSTITPICANKTFVAAVNGAMASWATTNGFVWADTHTALEDPGNPGCLLSAYNYGDNVHLNDAGSYVETQTWINAGNWR